jgi:single-strand DNA-binding protein
MASYFIVHIGGNLGKDPETRFTPSGQKVTTFSMAINQRRGKEEVTTWVRVTIWGDRFDKLIPYLKKGSAVTVTGRMSPPSSYTDKEGRTQITLEVTAELIDFTPFSRGDRPGEGQPQQSASFQGGHAAHESQGSSYDEGQFQAGYASQYQKPSNYGAQTAGQGSNYSQSADDEALPF